MVCASFPRFRCATFFPALGPTTAIGGKLFSEREKDFATNRRRSVSRDLGPNQHNLLISSLLFRDLSVPNLESRALAHRMQRLTRPNCSCWKVGLVARGMSRGRLC